MNPIYAITNDDPRVVEGLKIIGATGTVTQRTIMGPTGDEAITVFWAPGVQPFDIGGPDMRQLDVHEGYECMSGDLISPLYRRITASTLQMMGIPCNYREPVYKPPPPTPPLDVSPVGVQLTGNIYAYVGTPKFKVGEEYKGDPRGTFIMRGTQTPFGIMNAIWEKVA